MSNAAKRKKKRVAKSVSSSSLTPPQLPPQQPTTPSKGRIRQIGARLLDSAIDAALDNVWSIIGGIIWSALMAVAVALILYFRAGRASWLYPVLKYGLAFAAGWLTLLMFLVALALLGLYRRRRQEGHEKAKYVSHQKGYLDYRAELKPTMERFQAITTDIAKEMAAGSKIAEKYGKRIDRFGSSPVWSLRVASLGARAFRKHAARLERLSEKLEIVGAAVVEVSQGSLHYAPPASQGNKQQLLATQQALVVANNALLGTITALQNYRNHAIPVKDISRNMATAANYLIAVIEKHVATLTRMQSDNSATFALLKRKLSS